MSLGGDLWLITLSGTTASAPVSLHNAPNQVDYAEPFAWAPGDKWVVYTATSNDTPGTSDLFAVDVGGPEPRPPIKLDGGVHGGDTFIAPFFGPDDSRVFYPRVLDPTPEMYVAGLATPAQATPLHPPGFGALDGPISVAPDGKRAVLNGRRTGADTQSVFLVELDELDPVEASPPLGVDGWMRGGTAWTADSRRAFYMAYRQGPTEAFQVDVAVPGAPARISSEGHEVDSVYVISPLP